MGTAYVQFEGVPDATNPLIRPAFYVQQGFTARAPFHTLRVANTAQPGKLMRFMFGTDIDFIPSLNGQVAITGSVNATPYGMPYQASYKSQTNMGANTPDTIFTPGSNANGAVVWSASSYSSGAGSIPSSMIAKSSAPAGILDGDVIATTDFIGPTGASFISSYRLLNPVFVAAGKGLYHIPQQAETGSQRCVLYTLL